MKVDLPAPLGPSRPKIEPRGIARSMPFSACIGGAPSRGGIGLDEALGLDRVLGKVHCAPETRSAAAASIDAAARAPHT